VYCEWPPKLEKSAVDLCFEPGWPGYPGPYVLLACESDMIEMSLPLPPSFL